MSAQGTPLELFILLAVVRWSAGIARAAGRSPSAWGAAGAAAYFGGLFISAFAVGPFLSAVFKGDKLGLGLAFYLVVINGAGLALAHSICLAQFNKNLTTLESFARLLNIGAIVIASLYLIPPLTGLFITGHPATEEMVIAMPMAALFMVAVATLFVLRSSRAGGSIVRLRAFTVLSANLVLAAVLLWYGTTWVLSSAATMDVIGAYIFCWSTVAVGLNVVCIGLLIRSSRRLERRG